MRAAIFHPAAREAIRSFPEDVRREIGKAVFDLQRGEALGMPLSRPMPSIASGAAELRTRHKSGIYRAFYYASSSKGFYKKDSCNANAGTGFGEKTTKGVAS